MRSFPAKWVYSELSIISTTMEVSISKLVNRVIPKTELLSSSSRSVFSLSWFSHLRFFSTTSMVSNLLIIGAGSDVPNIEIALLSSLSNSLSLSSKIISLDILKIWLFFPK